MEDALLQETIRLATLRILQTQSADGSWRDCFDTGLMPDAQTAIFLHLLGVRDGEWVDPLLRRILKEQRSDGGWGLYAGDDGDLSVSVECYYALTVYDAWPVQQEGVGGEACGNVRRRAGDFIRARGGLLECRNLTKMLLAIGGEIPWESLPSPRLYSHLFSRFSPVSIRDITMFTRLHIAPMLLLGHLRYVSDVVTDPVLQDLRVNEAPYWGQIRGKDRRARRRPAETNMSRMPLRLRRCVDFILREREADGTVAGYHSSTFLMLLAIRALGKSRELPYDAILTAQKRNRIVDPQSGFVHQQTCNAHVWNTALSIGGLVDAGMRGDAPSIKRAVEYLAAKQHTCGAWGYSDNNTMHPDTDDTVACLDALARTGRMPTRAFERGVTWLLSMQKQDGGWAAFERDSDKRWLERIPANDMKRAMHDPSTPDITARVVEFVLKHRVVGVDDERVVQALSWLKRHQEPDGSWYGRWGNTYLYGSWCAVKALAAAGLLNTDMGTKVKRWLLSVQLPDGSFGESCDSDALGRFVPTETGVPTQTAWALDTLLYLAERGERTNTLDELGFAAHRAASWLMAARAPDGWHEDVPSGTAFPGALYIRYHIYPKVWPLVALSHYHRIFEGDIPGMLTLKGGEANVGSSIAGYVSRSNREPALLAADVSNSPFV